MPYSWKNFYTALGRTFQVLLFGFLAAQISARYYESFPKDRIALKAVAWTSFLLSLALTVMLVCEIAVDSIVTARTISLVLATEKWTSFTFILFNGLVMSVSQLFFSRRIRQISRKTWLHILICILSVMQLGGSLVHSVLNTSNFGFISFDHAFSYVWIASTIVCDLTITLSMIWFLREARGGAKFNPTKTMLGKIFTFTLETGLITTLWMTLQLILQISLVNNGGHFDAYLIFFYPSGTLYSVWLLATLNARSSFNKDLPSFVDVTNLLTVPGEIHFKHPTVEGTEVVISITTNGVASHDGISEVDSDSPFRTHEPQESKSSDDVLT